MTDLDARVPVTTKTRDDLRRLKRDNDRYEDVLRRLLRDRQGEV